MHFPLNSLKWIFLLFNIRLLPAIAFETLDAVVDAFEIVLDSNIISDVSQKVVDYSEDTWIGRLLEEMLAGHHNSLTSYGIELSGSMARSFDFIQIFGNS